MIRLLTAETKRLLARRMTRYFPLGLAGLIIGGFVIAYLVISNDDGNSPDFVFDLVGGPSGRDALGPMTTLLPVMGFVIGASYIGADLKTGMIEQLLTWEPRRLRLLGARTVASIAGVAVIAVALGVLWVACAYGLAATAGTTDGATGELWANIATMTLRAGLAAGLFAVFGLAITLLVNSSVGSIVGFVIYWFIIENIVISVFVPKIAVYLPVTNASSFGSGNDVQRISGNAFSEDGPDLISHHGYLTAGAVLVGWTLLALVVAAGVFDRRDVA
ncbi:MAG: hypothetical protein GY698_17545 [Actinomycetia bacterium]|nr:hypothetical protein [Actinomycetes bacterium]